MVSKRLLITSMGVCLLISRAANAVNYEGRFLQIDGDCVHIAMNGALEISGGIITNGSVMADVVTEVLQKFDTDQLNTVQGETLGWKPWMLWQYYVQFHQCEFNNTSDLERIVAAFPEKYDLQYGQRRKVTMSACLGASIFAMVRAFLETGIDVELYGSNIPASEAGALPACSIPEGTMLTLRSVSIHLTHLQCSDGLLKRIVSRFLELEKDGKLKVEGDKILFVDENGSWLADLNKNGYRLCDKRCQL